MQKSTIKNIIIVVVVIVALFIAYSMFLKPDGTKTAGTLASQQTGQSATIPIMESETTAEADTLLRLLTSLENLELNDSIFFNPAFKALRDIGIPLVKEGNAGRRNPFAPIGTDPVPVTVVTGNVGTNNQDLESEVDADDSGFGIFGGGATN